MQVPQEQFTGKYIDSDVEKKNKKKKSAHSKILMNVSDTQYSVVKFVGKKIMNWNLEYSSMDQFNFDICWTDNVVKPEFLAKMQPHQKINHFPHMSILSRKNNLGRNLMKLRKQQPEQYSFFPMTFILPNDYLDLKCYNMNRKEGKAQTFIVKPESGCQGRGIYLTRNIEKIKMNDKCVVQRYLHKPFLLDELKFDLRIYVLITGIDPLRIFVYQQGLVRLATQPYVAPKTHNLQEVCMHLTNYAINKESPNFQYNQSTTKMDVGHKRSLTYLYNLLKQKGHDIDKLKTRINDLIIKTFISGHPTLSQTYRNCQQTNFRNNMCFELLGFDIILDHKLNPILLQINYTPSFSTDTPLDSLIKKNAIRDTIRLLNINQKTKMQYKAEYDKEVKERLMSAKRKKYTDQQRYQLIDKAAFKRDLHELDNLGGFTRIYPTSQVQIQHYSRFFDLVYELIDPNMNTLYPSQKYRKKTGKLYYQPQYEIPVIRSNSMIKPRKKKVSKFKRPLETLSCNQRSPKSAVSKPKIKNSFYSSKQISKPCESTKNRECNLDHKASVDKQQLLNESHSVTRINKQ